MRVLIAEDDTGSRTVLVRSVEKLGHECLAADDGDKAWELFRKTPEVDVVISDWMMPNMDGLELCRRIRGEERDEYTYFIFLTALEDKEHLLEGMRAGADDYLTKPLDCEQLQVRMITADRITSLHRRLNERSKERLRTGVANVPIVLFAVDREGVITLSEGKGLEVLGLEPGEVVGQSVFEVYRDVPQIMENVRRALAGEALHTNTKVAGLVFETWYSPLREESGEVTGVVGVAIDVTERKRTEEALKESEELYRTVVEQANENIFLVDVETKRVLQANPILHRSLGYDPEELKQMTLYDIDAHDRESVDRDMRRIMAEGRHLIGERRYRRKDGTLMDVEVSVSALPYGDGEAMCVAHDVTERKRTEKELKRSLEVLLALREAGQILGSTLESEEIISRLLEIMQRVSSPTTTVISGQDEHRELRIWRSVGLEKLWRRTRFSPEATAARRAALKDNGQQLFRLQRPDSGTGHLVGLCLPLRTQERVLGVLEAYGSESWADSDTVEILSSLTNQAASALENARLYGKLAEREDQLQELVGKLIAVQEEERHRVAYELHDGLTQMLVAAHQHLQSFADYYPLDSVESRKEFEWVLELVQRTVREARRVVGDLRPTALDDFGLATAIRQQVEALRHEDWQVDYEEDLGDERLPPAVETALFRVAQEALTNARKHAQTTRAHVELRRHLGAVSLRVRDWGHGFDPTASGVQAVSGERVGLSGMRERVALLGGNFEVSSRPGVGTLVGAEVPLSLDQGKGKSYGT